MSLPAAWVDELLSRLTVRYGASFMRQYEGVDINLVRGDWCVALSGQGADQIKFALTILPADWPPNAGQFADLCKRAPRVVETMRPALQAPKADPDRVRAIIAKMTNEQRWANPAAQCVHNINESAKRARLTFGQRWVKECCEKIIY